MMIDQETSSSGAPYKVAENTSAMQATPETGEHYNGYTLMVEAYAAIWLILMGWLLMMWRKQAELSTRVAGLEASLDRAEKRMIKDVPPKPEKAEKKAPNKTEN